MPHDGDHLVHTEFIQATKKVVFHNEPLCFTSWAAYGKDTGKYEKMRNHNIRNVLLDVTGDELDVTTILWEHFACLP